MTAADRELAQQGPWPAGVNNVAPETNPPRDQNGAIVSVREAVNVDFDATGWPHLRRGHSVEVNGVAHSLFATDDYLFAVVDGVLKAFTNAGGPLAEVASIRAVGDRFCSLTSDDADVLWSNGLDIRRISDTTDLPVWIDTPDPVGVSVASAGGLAAGQYEVSVTAVDAQGRESGASDPAVLTLADGQGIDLTFPSIPETAVTWRVYVSPPDGDVLYLASERPVAVTSLHIGTYTPGAELKTSWLAPLVPCTVLRYGHGRLVGLTGDALVWSEPYTALMRDDSSLGLTRGTMLEPVGEGGDGAGWFVSDFKRTYFLAGPDPAKGSQVIRYGHPAVPGTSVVVPGSVFGPDYPTAPVVFFLAANGVFCVGLPGGTVKTLRESELALPVDAERGASGLMAFDGIRQIVTSLLGGTSNSFRAGVSDDASATIRRHGIEL